MVSQKSAALPAPFSGWFASRGWTPHGYQLALLEAARAGRSTLLIAPTGGGKTLAGFLPSLIDLAARGGDRGLHTLYLSPLKALAVDVARNLQAPVGEMGLSIGIETRTGDTPPARRRRQLIKPPDMLLTTPEQLALMLAYRDAANRFRQLRCVVIDELHAMAANKRGDLLALGLARLREIAPQARMVGLSATVADPPLLLDWLCGPRGGELIQAPAGPPPQIEILEAAVDMPWASHTTMHAMPDIYRAISAAQTALIFVNTRSQSEMTFEALWRLNDLNLPIALHHGSLAPERRRKVEAAMARGDLRAVVCTSTLDLGIDWGAVDLVIQLGAPKGISRLLQRIGRSNHRFDCPSRAMLVPSNRFEVLECRAALKAITDGARDGGEVDRQGGLDVLAQHILGTACGAPFSADRLYAEVVGTRPYRNLDRATFDRVLGFVATGGYALRQYDRWHRLTQTPEKLWRVANATVAQQYRLNVGTIIEAPMLRVVLRGKRGRGGREIGLIEEAFIEPMKPGDTFRFAGEILRFERLNELVVEVSRAPEQEAMIPIYGGGKFPLSTHLAERVREILADPRKQRDLPDEVRDWLNLQRRRSVLPKQDEVLVEQFQRGAREYMVVYPFDGRPAHYALAVLLTRRMERAGLHPLGFVANDYAFAMWSLKPAHDLTALFSEDILGDDLEEWLEESSMLKRTFRNVATIAGLIERRHPGQEKSGRQMTVSADLIYKVLRDHEPDHVLLQATREDAKGGLLDLSRLAALLRRAQGRIRQVRLDRISPLAVPVILEIGRESFAGGAIEALLEEAAAA
jgi:ATP-dependent helicase Lhr and Lhr-like helicase